MSIAFFNSRGLLLVKIILQRNDLREYRRSVFFALFIVSRTHQLERRSLLCLREIGLRFGGKNLFALRVETLVEILSRIVRVAQKALILLHSHVRRRFRVHPMNDALNLDAARIAAAAAFGDIRAQNFLRVAVFVQQNVVAAHDIGVFQAHVAIFFQAEIFGRRVERKVRTFDIEIFGKFYFADARALFGLIDLEIHFFRSLVIGDREFQRRKHRHGALGVGVEIFAHARLEIGIFALGIGFRDAHARAEIADRLGGDTAVAKGP